MGMAVADSGHCHVARVDAFFQLAQPANAAYEINTLVVTQIGDVENGGEQMVRAQRYVKAGDRVGGDRFWFEGEPILFAVRFARQIHAELAGAGGGCTRLRLSATDRKCGVEPYHQRRLFQVMQILHHAVVIHDLRLMVGKITARKQSDERTG